MWHSSDRAQRGYMLMEVAVALLALVLILVLSAQLLFATRRASVRQQLHVEARQVARGAADYLSFQLRGATDLVTDAMGGLNGRNPLAVMAWTFEGSVPASATTWPDCGATADPDCKQKSFNNVTDANLADVGTDIISVARTDSIYRIGPLRWVGSSFTAANMYWRFDLGCPPTATGWGDGDIPNRDLFKSYTGFHTDNCPVGSSGCSEPIVLVDAAGMASFYQITDYKDGANDDTCRANIAALDAECTDNSRDPTVNPGPCFWTVSSPANATPNLPGGQRNLTVPFRLLAGVRFVSFRVCQGWLEQKAGLFDATADANCQSAGWNTGAWTPLLPDVEDLQIAYLFQSGTTGNASAATQLATIANIPVQGLPANALDVTRIIGFRVTVTARSSTEVVGEGKRLNIRPAAEDHAAGTAETLFYYHQVSAASMLRNRAPQS